MKYPFFSLLLIISGDLAGQSGYFITSSDSTKLYVQEFGTGEPLIFLAGGPGLNAVYLKPVWDNLSDKFRCVVLDQRATGKSTLATMDSAKMSLSKYVDDLEALRKHLKLDQMTLIGHSWGAMLSMEYAARRPINVKKLLLLGPGGPTGKFYRYFWDNLRMRLNDEDLKELAELDSLKKPILQAIWPGYFYNRKRALATKSVTDFEMLEPRPGIHALVAPMYISLDNERTRLLKNYHGPVEIIQGRQDPIGESTACEIKNLLPQTQIYFIEKCGHLPWLENSEQAERFFDALNSFLQ